MEKWRSHSLRRWQRHCRRLRRHRSPRRCRRRRRKSPHRLIRHRRCSSCQSTRCHPDFKAATRGLCLHASFYCVYIGLHMLWQDVFAFATLYKDDMASSRKNRVALQTLEAVVWSHLEHSLHQGQIYSRNTFGSGSRFFYWSQNEESRHIKRSDVYGF